MFNSRPNPAVEYAEIPYSVGNTMNAQITIFDATSGRLVRSFEVSGEGTLTVNGLASGVYTYTLFVNNKKVDSKKMVVTK